MYFWRTTEQQEVDLIELYDGEMTAFEMKWRKSKAALPAAFSKRYPEARFQIVNSENYIEFLNR